MSVCVFMACKSQLKDFVLQLGVLTRGVVDGQEDQKAEEEQDGEKGGRQYRG